MRSIIKPVLYLLIVFALDLALRKGYLVFPLPFKLPLNGNILFYFFLFMVLALFFTRWFSKKDGGSLNTLGIGCDSKNRVDFLYGFFVGLILWGIVSLVQGWTAGFSWELKSNINWIPVCYGLVFIFIADLGTELFTRGYALSKFKDSFGAKMAIVIMVFFVGLTSMFSGASGELLVYAILIPILHTVFFSIIYFKTKRLGAAVGVHTGANFITISIFDLRVEQPGLAIPSGIFGPNVDVNTLSLSAVQLPWVVMAVLFSILVYFWWQRNKQRQLEQ